MAKKTNVRSETTKVRDGDPFKQKAPMPETADRYFAVKFLRGPRGVKVEGYQVIKAWNEPDAKRQWFNKYGFAQRSHAFDLQVVELDRNHPACKEAFTANKPGEGEGLSLMEMIDADFSDVQQQIATGPVPPIKKPAPVEVAKT